MIVTRTPFRISLFGGGTDYPEWYLKNGGAVLGASINHYCDVVLHKSGLVWKCFDLPTKSGLGTSSAYTVGLLRACSNLDNEALAKIAIEWERDKSGGNVGHQDQYICSIGGFLHITFSDRGIEYETIPSNGLDKNLMLFYTGIRSTGSYSVIEEQLSSIKQNDSILKEIHSLVDEGIKNITNGIEFGKLLNETWQLKRKLTEHISTPEIDAMYKEAIDAGAIGGKLLGAGNGGFLLLYVETDKQNHVRDCLGIKNTPFRFESEGTRILYADYQP